MKRILALLTVLVALLVAGCGGSTPTSHSVGATGSTGATGTKTVQVCSGLTDKCTTITVPSTPIPTSGVIPGGPKFPDVSSFQGHPNWVATKAAGYAGAAIKAGEFVEDPDFAFNATTLRSLHMFWAPYWFVRNTGCTHEGNQIVSVINSVGGLTSGPVILDMEVPEAFGYAGCLDSIIFRAFHRHAVIYTAPGTWPGGSHFGLSLWEADYNFSASISPFWKPMVAWQFTDSSVGPKFFVSGVGWGDVSVDYGLTKLVPSPVDPFAIFPKTTFKFGELSVSEYTTVKTWVDDRCVNPVRRTACYESRISDTLLRGRLYFLASHKQVRGGWVAVPAGHFRWNVNHLGARFQVLSRVLTNVKPITL